MSLDYTEEKKKDQDIVSKKLTPKHFNQTTETMVMVQNIHKQKIHHVLTKLQTICFLNIF